MSQQEPDHCEFCGVELTEQTKPIFIAGPPPATEPSPAPAWPDGWVEVGYTEEGSAFRPNGTPVNEPPPDLTSVRHVSIEIGPGILHHPPEEK